MSKGYTITASGVKVFAHEFDGRTSYSLGVSSPKYVNGQKTNEYVNAYIYAQFPRDNAPRDKDRIDILSAFPAAYEGRDGKVNVKYIVTQWKWHEESGWD